MLSLDATGFGVPIRGMFVSSGETSSGSETSSGERNFQSSPARRGNHFPVSEATSLSGATRSLPQSLSSWTRNQAHPEWTISRPLMNRYHLDPVWLTSLLSNDGNSRLLSKIMAMNLTQCFAQDCTLLMPDSLEMQLMLSSLSWFWRQIIADKLGTGLLQINWEPNLRCITFTHM